MPRTLLLLPLAACTALDGTHPFTPDRAFVWQDGDAYIVVAAAFGPEGSCATGERDAAAAREALTCERAQAPLGFEGGTYGGHHELWLLVRPEWTTGLFQSCVGPDEEHVELYRGSLHGTGDVDRHGERATVTLDVDDGAPVDPVTLAGRFSATWCPTPE